MDSCPVELKAYEKAYVIQQNNNDIENWQLGQYILASIGSAFSKKAKYPQKPMFQKEERQNKPLSEKELQRQRELFVAKLEVMKTNFELNHKDSTVS